MKFYIDETSEYIYNVTDGDECADEDTPSIELTQDEFNEWEKVRLAFMEWQYRFSQTYTEYHAEPRPPFQTMEDYEREIKEFLK